MARTAAQFQTIRSEGALLPPDVLQLVIAQKADGSAPAAYHLPPDTKVNEAIAHSWSVLQKYWRGFQEIRKRLPDDDTGTVATNQNWLLPLFEELKYNDPLNYWFFKIWCSSVLSKIRRFFSSDFAA